MRVAHALRALIAGARTDPGLAQHDQTAGAAYAALIEAELREEADRRRSIDGRAQTIITSVAAIATLGVAVAPAFARVQASPAADQQALSASGLAASVCVPMVYALEQHGPQVCVRIPDVVTATWARAALAPDLALVTFAGITLVAAVLMALWAMAPTVYEVAQIDALDRLVDETFWRATIALGSRRTAEVRAKELRAARIANARKVRRFSAALICEVIGVIALGAVGVARVWDAGVRP